MYPEYKGEIWSGNINLGVVPNEISKRLSVDKGQKRYKIWEALINLETGQKGGVRKGD